MNFEQGKEIIKNIVKNIEMTPIHELLTNKIDEQNFDILQLIAESHIAIHKNEENIRIDVFSCKGFDENKIFDTIGNNKCNVELINRGIKFEI